MTERVVQHFVHCIETHGRHVEYLKFLQTIVKSEGTYIRKCQDTVMAEVSGFPAQPCEPSIFDAQSRSTGMPQPLQADRKKEELNFSSHTILVT